MKLRQRIIILALGALGVVVGAFAWRPVADFVREKGPVEPPIAHRTPPKMAAPTPRQLGLPHLQWAEKECDRIVDEHLLVLAGFFSDSKKNTRLFTDEALSWGSKWRLIADKVPYTRGGRHEEFIRGEFEETILKPRQIETAVQQVIRGYIKEVESIESQMLVRIQADVADFPVEYPVGAFDNDRLKETYDSAIRQAINATQDDAAAGASLEVVSLIVGEVLTQVAVEFGVSAGILGAGAVLSWETFGIGIVVGVIVDAIVSWVWNWYADPKGELAVKINRKLDDMHNLIVDGSKNVTGLRARLRELARKRARVRETAVLAVLNSQ